MKPRLVAIERLWHVGDLNPGSKRRNSYEGAGLSVSMHPNAWRMIARGLVTGTTWEMARTGARFLDALRLTASQKKQIMVWGLAEGYVIATELWKWTYWDDELETEVCQTFATRQEAIDEADLDGEGDDFDDGCIARVSGHMSTARLDGETMQDRTSLGTTSVLELLLPIYADRVLCLDGVWWGERLDPVRLSAPRGVIVPRRVAEWATTRCAVDPDEDEF